MRKCELWPRGSDLSSMLQRSSFVALSVAKQLLVKKAISRLHTTREATVSVCAVLRDASVVEAAEMPVNGSKGEAAYIRRKIMEKATKKKKSEVKRVKTTSSNEWKPNY